MPFFLSSRDRNSIEKMDDPNCNQAALKETYQQFKTINALISQWRIIYRNRIRPYLRDRGESHILDIGFGGGDIPINLAKWASRDHLDLSITAIDPDERAFKFVQQLEQPGNVEFQQRSSTELVGQGVQYDFVISNHLLHHLSSDELHRTLSEAKALSSHAVIFNDIRRSDIGYTLFNLLARPVFRSSFITHDGLTSIKRSYTPDELREAVPKDWMIETLFPYRLLLTYYHER